MRKLIYLLFPIVMLPAILTGVLVSIILLCAASGAMLGKDAILWIKKGGTK